MKDLKCSAYKAIWGLSLLLIAGGSIATEIPSEIKAAVKSRVDFGLSQGIVIARLDNGEVDYFSYGKSNIDGQGDSHLTRKSVFEVGSVTKVFVALLLADAVTHGELNYQDPIIKYLAKGVDQQKLQKITLEMLATHSSGLPRMPNNFEPQYYKLSPVGYTRKGLYQYLNQPELNTAAVNSYHYSNLGYGILGHIIEGQFGLSLHHLLKEKIADPLKMNSTVFGAINANQQLLVQGHHGTIKVANLPGGALAGSGSILSSAEDLVKFLDAFLVANGSELSKSMADTTNARLNAWENTDIGLGWHIEKQSTGQTIHWHNGSTGGYHAFVGMDLAAKKATVVLANSGGDGNDDLGFNLLNNTYPIKATPKHQQIKVEADKLEQYVGTYDTEFGLPIEITLVQRELRAKFAEQFALKLYPKSEQSFFYRAINAQISFSKDNNNRPMLTLHQDGESYPAIKNSK